MAQQDAIRFDDGAAYDAYMGHWSRLAGEVFLDWLALPDGLRWLDVGCGSGAFTALLARRCAPRALHAIDPSAAQVAFAQSSAAAPQAHFAQGDALALDFPDRSFDAAVMALVIFFVSDPRRGLAEMARVVRPGGAVAAYAWDVPGGGFPYAALGQELRALGVTPPLPPSADISGLEALRALWQGAGLEAVRTHEITVQRTFSGFDAFWETAKLGPSMAQNLALLDEAQSKLLQQRLRERLAADAQGRITYSARANAVSGRVPAASRPQ